VLGALAVLVLCGSIVGPPNAQQASRYALTAAIVDHGTIRIDRYEHMLFVDYVMRDGHLYSDKTPGQPVLGVPFYAMHRAIGGDPASDPDADQDLGAWWVTLWTAAVPTALLVLLLASLVRRVVPGSGIAPVLAIVFGSLLLPMGSQQFAHPLAALLAVATVHLWSLGDRRSLALCGLAAGSSVLMEYTGALLVAIVGVATIIRWRRASPWFFLGATPPALALLAYHAAAFGGPLEFSYRYSRYAIEEGVGDSVGWPTLTGYAQVLLGDRGLLLLTPVAALAIAGLVVLARESVRARPEALVAIALVIAYVSLQAAWSNPTGGASPGPRYVAPALPFLAIGLAHIWTRLRRWPQWLAAVSALTMTVATIVDPFVPRDSRALRYWVDRLTSLELMPTLLHPVVGRAGTIMVIGAAAALVAASLRTDAPGVTRRTEAAPLG
jgi:hypothetical protein